MLPFRHAPLAAERIEIGGGEAVTGVRVAAGELLDPVEVPR
jgi:hypothetical protein